MNNAYVRLLIYLYTSEKNSADYVIANVLLSHFKDFPDILIEQIAKEANATAATVTKFAHKLGYKNFKELRCDCLSFEEHHRIDTQIQMAQSSYEHACSLFFHEERAKLSFYEHAHPNDMIHDIASCFYNSKTIGICYPSYAYSCVHVLRNYITQMDRSVIGVMRDVNVDLMRDRMQDCESVVLISLQGDWVKENLRLLNRWKEQGKKIILITAVYDEDFYGIPDMIVPFHFVGETIIDSAYQIATVFVKASLACANFPKLEKSKA